MFIRWQREPNKALPHSGVQAVRRGFDENTKSAGGSAILFTFVMLGGMALKGEGRDPHKPEAGDAFVIPPGTRVRSSDTTDDLGFLEVSLPWAFKTHFWSGE